MQQEVLTESEKIRRPRADASHYAPLKAGMSLDEFERAREQRFQR